MRFIDALIKSGRTVCGWYDMTNYLAMDPDGRVFGYEQRPTPNVIGWGIENRKNSTDGCGCRMNLDVDEIDDDWNICIVTRAQYEGALATSHKVEWDGVGLPPVGCECEFKATNGGWGVGTVLYVWNNRVFWLCHEDGDEYTSEINPQEFRPLRSEADKKRDEAKHAIAELCRSSASNGHSADLIYDAIAAGKIPHIRIE